MFHQFFPIYNDMDHKMYQNIVLLVAVGLCLPVKVDWYDKPA